LKSKNKYLKILLTTKHCAATPRKTHRKGSTAGSCVSAIVARHAFGTAGNDGTDASSMRRLRMYACSR
jgi:hypothetical protein